MKCKICEQEVKNNLGLSQHLYKKHSINFYDYNMQYNNLAVPKCEFCGDNCKIRTCISFNKTCGKEKCKNLYIKKYIKHTEETKEKIRQKCLGRESSLKGKNISNEQKLKQSEKMKGRYIGEKNPNFGNKWAEEQRKHLSEIKKKQYKGRKWITNGKFEKFVNLDKGLPQGYSLGRLKRSSI